MLGNVVVTESMGLKDNGGSVVITTVVFRTVKFDAEMEYIYYIC
jgi:hypothetical protein